MFGQTLLENLFYIESAVICIALSTYFMCRWTKAATVPPPKVTSPLQELNNEFYRQYRKARDNFWSSAIVNGSVIIASGSSLTLIHEGIRYPFPKAIPQIYHDLKSISHIPLTIYLLLTNNSSSPTDDTLEQYRQRLKNLQVPDSIGPNERPSVDRIVQASRDLLQTEMDNRGSIDSNRLEDFCRSLTNDLVILLDAAGIAQLNQMHEIVQDWLNRYNIDRESASLKVLIIGARTARRNNLQTAYFERLLGAERRRHISYIEEMFDNEKKATVIFSTWFFDEQLSVSFFGDNDRMHRDLLMSERVQQQIDNLIPS